MQIYFITGISGSGKTTVARKLNELNYVAFDSKINKGIFHFADEEDNEPTEFHLKNIVWSKQYKWVLNKQLFDQLLKQHKNAEQVFLCGTGNIIKYKHLAHKIFLLKIDEKTLAIRLNNPSRDNNFGKDKDTQISIIKKRSWIQKRLIKAGAITIDATQPIDFVVRDILSQI